MAFFSPFNPPIADWHGRSVWLVGASSGIGLACAQALHAAGARVCVSARQAALLQDFVYSDGTSQYRIWTLTHLGDGRFSGQAGDVIGSAEGHTRGNAFNWRYTMALPVNDQVWQVQFDDWMYLMNEQVMLNKASMSKFGIFLGEVTLSFTKRA